MLITPGHGKMAHFFSPDKDETISDSIRSPMVQNPVSEPKCGALQTCPRYIHHYMQNCNILNVHAVVTQRKTCYIWIFVHSRLKQSETADSVLQKTAVIVKSPIVLQQ